MCELEMTAQNQCSLSHNRIFARPNTEGPASVLKELIVQLKVHHFQFLIWIAVLRSHGIKLKKKMKEKKKLPRNEKSVSSSQRWKKSKLQLKIHIWYHWGKKRCFNGMKTSLLKTYFYFPYSERAAEMTPKTAIQVTVLETLKNVCSLIHV